MEAAVKQAITIHLRDPPGDILIFMTGGRGAGVADFKNEIEMLEFQTQALDPARSGHGSVSVTRALSIH